MNDCFSGRKIVCEICVGNSVSLCSSSPQIKIRVKKKQMKNWRAILFSGGAHLFCHLSFLWRIFNLSTFSPKKEMALSLNMVDCRCHLQDNNEAIQVRNIGHSVDLGICDADCGLLFEKTKLWEICRDKTGHHREGNVCQWYLGIVPDAVPVSSINVLNWPNHLCWWRVTHQWRGESARRLQNGRERLWNGLPCWPLFGL